MVVLMEVVAFNLMCVNVPQAGPGQTVAKVGHVLLLTPVNLGEKFGLSDGLAQDCGNSIALAMEYWSIALRHRPGAIDIRCCLPIHPSIY